MPAIGRRRRRHPAIRFNARFKPSLSAKISKGACKILRKHLFNNASKICKKAPARIGAIHHYACKDRQIRHDIITTAFCEFLLKAVRPVLRPGLPTVNKNIIKAELNIS